MYFSELFYKPDGLVKDAVQVPVRTVGRVSQIADKDNQNDNQICTLFPAGSRRVRQVVTLRRLTSAATIHYQIGTPPVQQRFLPHIFTLALCGPQSLTCGGAYIILLSNYHRTYVPFFVLITR